VAEVAALLDAVGVPGRLDGVDEVRRGVRLRLEPDVVEDVELGLGSKERGVCDAGRQEVRLGLGGDLARVTAVGLARVRVDAKLTLRVFSTRNGSRYAVVTSGISFMSDSWIAWKPRIDEPSNIWPSVKKSEGSEYAGTLKCCITPGRSQNRMSTNLTSSSSMNFRTSSALLNIRCSSARCARYGRV